MVFYKYQSGTLTPVAGGHEEGNDSPRSPATSQTTSHQTPRLNPDGFLFTL